MSSKSSCEDNSFVEDIGDIFGRLFNHKSFLEGEINFFIKEFELKRSDRDVENLFDCLQSSKSTGISRSGCLIEHPDHLQQFQLDSNKTLNLIRNLVNRQSDPDLGEQLERNRKLRQEERNRYLEAIEFKRSNIDRTFQLQREELQENCSDLERKLFNN